MTCKHGMIAHNYYDDLQRKFLLHKKVYIAIKSPIKFR